MGPFVRSLLRNTVAITVTAVLGALVFCGPASARSPVSPTPSATPSDSPGVVRIFDDSHVLSKADVASLELDAIGIPDPVRIYTTTRLSADKSAFDRHYEDMLNSAPSNVVIIAVNTRSRHVIITSGSDSELSDSEADQARKDFTDSYRSDHRYGDALRSALSVIRDSVTPESSITFPAVSGPGPDHRSGHSETAFIVVFALLIILIVIGAAKGRGSSARSHRGYSSSSYSDYSSSYSSSSYSDYSSSYDSGAFFDSGGSSGDSGGGDWSDSGGGSSSGDF